VGFENGAGEVRLEFGLQGSLEIERVGDRDS
jgi:hypothetical protein